MGTFLSRAQDTTTTTTTVELQHRQQQETTTTCDGEDNGVHGHGPALRIPDWLFTVAAADHLLPQSTLESWSKADVKDHATAYRALFHIRKGSFRVINNMRLEWIVDTLTPSIMSLSSSSSDTCSVSLPAQFAQIIQADIIHGPPDDGDNNEGAALEISLSDDHRIHVSPVSSSSSDPGIQDNDNDNHQKRYSIQIELCADTQKHVTLIDIDIMGDDKCHVHARSQLLLVDGKAFYYSPLYGMPDAEKENAANRPECIICLTELKSAALVPCQHVCLCTSCALILKSQHDPNSRRCPVCRTLIHSILILECEDDDVETREGP
ncbi:predicted protein [Lichtheimia corymbifera JMRC:FSU:9682]|uniref:RING-type domain-containing protein n=1 Tax=Lichtheimia corymbifera JMRC:FSU:9682 TaxID=1263082 RepID=A0A068S159_9FUNG|nr:predicted protein [Lichtheimia corymbifera JMRC:FSU:9682]